MNSRFFPTEDWSKEDTVYDSNEYFSSLLKSPISIKEEILLSARSSNKCSAATSSSSLKSNKNQVKSCSQKDIVNSNNWMTSNNNYICPVYTYTPFSMSSFHLVNHQIYNRETINTNHISNLRNHYNNLNYVYPNHTNSITFNEFAITNHFNQPVSTTNQTKISGLSFNPYYLKESSKVSLNQTSKEIKKDHVCHAIKISKASEMIIPIYERIDDFISNCKIPIEYSNTLKGSRHIQKLLTKEENKSYSFYLFIYPFIDILLTDVYGNYVCKKVFSLLKQNQRVIAWNNMSKDIKKYSEDQHANHSVQMLIAQSESDYEKDIIENSLFPYFGNLVFNENGINVLIAHLTMTSLKSKDSSLLRFIYKNLCDLARDETAVLLCNALIMKLAADQNDMRAHKYKILKILRPQYHDLIIHEVSSVMILKILEEWGLDFCVCLTSFICSNFMIYCTHPNSSSTMLRILEMLDINVSDL